MNAPDPADAPAASDQFTTTLNTQPRHTPPLGLALAYMTINPLVLSAAAAWALDQAWVPVITHFALVWGAAVLAFLAGVRRGLGFRVAGGPTGAQLAITLWLFALAVAALLSPRPAAGLGPLAAGYATMAVLDPLSAQRGEVPRYFTRLRPAQMVMAVLSLGALIARGFVRG